MIKTDSWIRYMCENRTVKVIRDGVPTMESYSMIIPFIGESVNQVDGKKVLSYGLSSMGYDVRLAPTFKLFKRDDTTIIDPLDLTDSHYEDIIGDSVVIPPNCVALGHTIEYFNIPDDVIVICMGKSTLARLSINVITTPIEPGFKGQVVIEIANLGSLPVRIHAGMGIAQFLFFQAEEKCDVSYEDRGGKYSGQIGLTTARL